MAQNLNQDFVDLSYRSLGADRPTEFGFNHGERGFYVAPLVIVGQKISPVQVVVVVGPLPQAITRVVPLVPNRIDLEGDIGSPTYGLNLPEDSSCSNRLCHPKLHRR